MQKPTITRQVIGKCDSYWYVYYFQYVLYKSVMLSIYAKLFIRLLAVLKRERCTHATNCVYLSKIENGSYYQEHVSHPMPVCWLIAYFSSNKTPSSFPWQLKSSRPRGDPGFFPSVFESAAVFFLDSNDLWHVSKTTIYFSTSNLWNLPTPGLWKYEHIYTGMRGNTKFSSTPIELTSLASKCEFVSLFEDYILQTKGRIGKLKPTRLGHPTTAFLCLRCDAD